MYGRRAGAAGTSTLWPMPPLADRLEQQGPTLTAHGRETASLSVTIERHDAEPADTGQRGFKGLASAFGTRIDAWMPTVILPGAFAATLADPEQMRRVKILYQHSDAEPIGRPTVLRETPAGLYIEGSISRTTRGNDAIVLLDDGVLTEMSIGFDAVAFSMQEAGDGVMERHITECRLWEVSLVTFGANREARITSVHQQATGADDTMARVLAHAAEWHAGRTLAPAHRATVQQAHDTLTAVLGTTANDDTRRDRRVEGHRSFNESLRVLELAARHSGV